MKILFLNYYQGAFERGLEVFINEIKKRLLKKYTVEVIAEGKTLQKRWPVLWRLFIDPQGLSILFFTIKNIPKIIRFNPDIVIPTNGGWQPAIIRLYSSLFRKKMVIVGQSGIGWDDINNLWCFPHCFVAISAKAKKWAKKVNPFIRVEKIPNGVDLEEFREIGGKIELGLEKPIILSVGALDEPKKHALAIKAVSQLKHGSLLILGDGSQFDELNKVGYELLGGKRFMIKGVKHEVISKYFRSSDVFTFPSWAHEAFGIVLLEAMACNLPVVARDDEIKREIIGDAGVFVNPEDIRDYLKGVKKALEKNWGNIPRMQAGKFSWDKICLEYEDLFKSLMKRA